MGLPPASGTYTTSPSRPCGHLLGLDHTGRLLTWQQLCCVHFKFCFLCSLEPDFSYLEALAPYQPLAMKCIYCPIDTRLNFIQVSKLLKEVQVRKGSASVSVQPVPAGGFARLRAEGRLPGFFSCPAHVSSVCCVLAHALLRYPSQ